jgi:predicted transcriptional regulator
VLVGETVSAPYAGHRDSLHHDHVLKRSGVSRAELASRIGTSRPRLSTYCAGSVTPSDALVERMRALVDRMSAG